MKFINNWKAIDGYRGFVLLNVWRMRVGQNHKAYFGIVICNFGVEWET